MRVKGGAWALAIVGLFTQAGAQGADAGRQAEVAARGAQVMPFNLSETTHVFTKPPNGAVQQVIAEDPQNARAIRMIRMHLGEIATHFAHGDFSAPTDIHGAQMPGLATLKAAKPGDIAVHYSDLTNGGQIEYASQNATLVAAIHEWFDAQLSDHGSDAMEGHHHVY